MAPAGGCDPGGGDAREGARAPAGSGAGPSSPAPPSSRGAARAAGRRWARWRPSCNMRRWGWGAVFAAAAASWDGRGARGAYLGQSHAHCVLAVPCGADTGCASGRGGEYVAGPGALQMGVRCTELRSDDSFLYRLAGPDGEVVAEGVFPLVDFTLQAHVSGRFNVSEGRYRLEVSSATAKLGAGHSGNFTIRIQDPAARPAVAEPAQTGSGPAVGPPAGDGPPAAGVSNGIGGPGSDLRGADGGRPAVKGLADAGEEHAAGEEPAAGAQEESRGAGAGAGPAGGGDGRERETGRKRTDHSLVVGMCTLLAAALPAALFVVKRRWKGAPGALEGAQEGEDMDKDKEKDKDKDVAGREPAPARAGGPATPPAGAASGAPIAARAGPGASSRPECAIDIAGGPSPVWDSLMRSQGDVGGRAGLRTGRDIEEGGRRFPAPRPWAFKRQSRLDGALHGPKRRGIEPPAFLRNWFSESDLGKPARRPPSAN